MNIKNTISARLRAFKIWQKTGNSIWVNTRSEREQKRRGFDSIPFLNDDAKRTFIHHKNRTALLYLPNYIPIACGGRSGNSCNVRNIQ